jgi:hypothetical protein
MVHVPQGAGTEAKRKMVKKINAAVAGAYSLPEFAIFITEHSLELVAINGGLLADDRQRVEDQEKVYS